MVDATITCSLINHSDIALMNISFDNSRTPISGIWASKNGIHNIEMSFDHEIANSRDIDYWKQQSQWKELKSENASSLFEFTYQNRKFHVNLRQEEKKHFIEISENANDLLALLYEIKNERAIATGTVIIICVGIAALVCMVSTLVNNCSNECGGSVKKVEVTFGWKDGCQKTCTCK